MLIFYSTLIILFGLVIIPFGSFYIMSKIYNRPQWWMLAIVVLYVILFFVYPPVGFIPDIYTAKPYVVYQCSWETKYFFLK